MITTRLKVFAYHLSGVSDAWTGHLERRVLEYRFNTKPVWGLKPFFRGFCVTVLCV